LKRQKVTQKHDLGHIRIYFISVVKKYGQNGRNTCKYNQNLLYYRHLVSSSDCIFCMGLPAKRRTKQSKRERAAHFALSKTSTSACPNCKRRIRPHRACPHCGYYKGRAIVKVVGKVERRSKRSAK
jgi:large subunit ribosomal protein L32